MRILIPLDGSPVAEQALEPAAHLAQRATRVPVTLVLFRAYQYVPPDALVLGAGMPFSQEEMKQNAQTYLKGVAQRPLFQGITVETRLEKGPAVTAICEQAKATEIDLILIASHGRTGMPLAIAGSVAEDVARESGIPTLIVRQETTAFQKKASDPFTILVPLDGTRLAEKALFFAKQFAAAFGASIRLLEVLPEPYVEDPLIQRHGMQTAQTYLAGIVDQLRDEGIRAYFDVSSGMPVEQIEQEVWLRSTDLIAIATHGRTGFDRLMKGSVAYAVLHHVPLPVMIVHPIAMPAAPK